MFDHAGGVQTYTEMDAGYVVLACLATRNWFWPPFRKTCCGATNPSFNLSVLKTFLLLRINGSTAGCCLYLADTNKPEHSKV